MQPRVCQVGPLAAPSATQIALAQSPSAAGALALNGAASSAVANNICLSQSGTAATPLTINGALAQTRFASPTIPIVSPTIAVMIKNVTCPIYITSAGNDSGITWTVVGMDAVNGGLSETVKGTNASVSATVNNYKSIISITPSGNTASTVTVGAMGFATLDACRRVIFTSSGNDSAATITISGTDWSSTPITETLSAGSGAAVSSVLDYLTVTQVKISAATAGTITVGTNGIAGSQWIPFDAWSMGTASIQCVVSGTVNYTVQTTNDDPNSYGNPVPRSLVAWDSTDGGLIAQTASASFGFAEVPAYMRVLLNSQTNPGFVRGTFVQHLSSPY